MTSSPTAHTPSGRDTRDALPHEIAAYELFGEVTADQMYFIQRTYERAVMDVDAALQEARESAAVWKGQAGAALAAFEAAESRLREVEDERDREIERLSGALLIAANELLHASGHCDEWVKQRYILSAESAITAASRPIPTAPTAATLLCFDGCRGCSLDDHLFGDAFRAYWEELIGELQATRDRAPNPCMNCGSCGRDGEGE